MFEGCLQLSLLVVVAIDGCVWCCCRISIMCNDVMICCCLIAFRDVMCLRVFVSVIDLLRLDVMVGDVCWFVVRCVDFTDSCFHNCNNNLWKHESVKSTHLTTNQHTSPTITSSLNKSMTLTNTRKHMTSRNAIKQQQIITSLHIIEIRQQHQTQPSIATTTNNDNCKQPSNITENHNCNNNLWKHNSLKTSHQVTTNQWR
jgi:hypothetical protein